MRSKPYSIIVVFNKSLREGTFPDCWKLAFINPIYKKGNKAFVENYRPVSILNALSKVFERLVLNHISPFVYSLISSRQHGFVPNRSTSTNLLVFSDYVASSLGRGIPVDVIYTDLSKAFDCVNHRLLLHKLHSFGFRSTLLNWFKTYLEGRFSRVVCNGHSSAWFCNARGVPQGSILGPVLFNVYINDLSDLLDCEHLMYADDLKLYSSISDRNDSIRLQDNLAIFSDWCARNGLFLNASKCRVMTFSTRSTVPCFPYLSNSIPINKVESFKDLGVIFDRHLRFDGHVSDIISHAYRMLGFIMRNTASFTNIKCMVTLYSALVRSKLEYASVIWNHLGVVRAAEIEKVQRRFTRYVYARIRRDHAPYTTRLADLNLQSLAVRRRLHDMTLLYRVANGLQHSSLIHHLTLRVPRIVSRSHRVFYVIDSSYSSVSVVSPFVRIQSEFDRIFSNVDVDLFATPWREFRLIVLASDN